MTTFHDTRFPTDIGFTSSGGPMRRTIVRIAASGAENRNSLWADSRRKYDIGYGIKTYDVLHRVIEFFEERRGRLYGFRFKDITDFKSMDPTAIISAGDQQIGIGDGVKTEFQLVKRYGSDFNPYHRKITRPVNGMVMAQVSGGVASFSVNHQNGLITFDDPPAIGDIVSAGFEFDVPVRFDSDEINADMNAFKAGEYSSIKLMELIE